MLITPKGMNKLSISILGLLTGISGVSISKVNSNLDTRLNDLGLTSRVSSKELLMDYLKDQQQITVKVTSIPVEERDLIEDIVEYWVKSDKHLMVIGGTGDGKSTAIKHLISKLVDWDITAYDVDYSQGDYPDKVQIRYDYESISEAMNDEIIELEERISDRRNEGKNYSARPKLTIAEELPALALEIGEEVSKWIRIKSSRGRKVMLKLACLAQNDTAENLALKGNIALRDNNFLLLYLGKKAIDKAKKDKDEQLIQWLQSASHGRGILDGKPCLININSYYTATDSNSNHLQSTTEGATNHYLTDSSKSLSEVPRSDDSTGIQQSEVENLLPNFDENSTNLGGNYGGLSDDVLIELAVEYFRKGGVKMTPLIKKLFGVSGGDKFKSLSDRIKEKL
jgi:energy-coupling factor transporter ATP-binding protein EcfA2